MARAYRAYGVSLKPVEMEAVQRAAKDRGVSVSAVIREALTAAGVITEPEGAAAA